MPSPFDIAGVGVNAIGNWLGADNAANAARQAAKQQQDALQRGVDVTKDTYKTGVAGFSPFTTAGGSALANLSSGLGDGSLTKGFGAYAAPTFSFDPNQDPGAQYSKDQANLALSRSAAAKGGLLAGGTIKSIDELNQNLGKQQFGAAYDRFNTDRSAGLQGYQANANNYYTGQGNAYSRLFGTAGLGLNAAGSAANLGQNYAGALSSLYGQQGDAAAAGTVGAANAWSKAIGGITNAFGGMLTLPNSGWGGSDGGATPGFGGMDSFAGPLSLALA